MSAKVEELRNLVHANGMGGRFVEDQELNRAGKLDACGHCTLCNCIICW
ncbi:MAG: hypothetical protein QG622_1420 [Actinomycetota bacterium]|nr:hypothetical protein [Actinomycetota bacterium]